MSEKKINITPEELASLEVGKTIINPVLSKILFYVFIAVITLVPIIQNIFSDGSTFSVKTEKNSSLFNLNEELITSFKDLEKDIEEKSLLQQYFLPRVQTLLTSVFKVGNEKVWIDNDKLYFYDSNKYVFSSGFLDEQKIKQRVENEGVSASPIAAIVDFSNQLKKQGIELVLMPVPSKMSINNTKGKLINNTSFSAFINKIKKENIVVLDLYNKLSVEDKYLNLDTHWTPKTMHKANFLLAKILDSLKVEKGNAEFVIHHTAVSNYGDIANMLKVKKIGRLFDKQTVGIKQVLENNYPLKPNKNSDVLLLGDSFSNIYSINNMEWGISAGLFENLSLSLNKTIDKITLNNNGAFATRQELANKLNRGENRLAGKKVIIWQFAERELSLGNWKLIPLKYNPNFETSFLMLKQEDEIIVNAVVEDVAKIPMVGSVPYKDHIVSVHLKEVVSSLNNKKLGDAVVYLESMKNNVWTPAASLNVGTKITLKLSNWQRKINKFGSLNRSELDDEILSLEEPLWGELIK
ncbi:hypothetical protein LPB136_12810 [Tenacibaculum todarodis]|uniref:AlgX/AlgJ SGNH hydrolase-like domain-containing protein n=1 Tax=Tenacibaculum todarodis TaxID=1850252 RepID=A0A1L3JM86_9FLAO|nr:hypothetical protein [Tenacibaculum todarodis]APG66199.1 hypothetical protein LPB136_12810 [Tenacibaculum todarodis]